MNSPQIIHRLKELVEFFQAIPNRQWCTGHICFYGTYCALGHLEKSGRSDEELREVGKLINEFLVTEGLMLAVHKYDLRYLIALVNDDDLGLADKFRWITPKERIVNVLKKRLEMESDGAV